MKKIISLFAAVLFAGSMMAAESVYKQTVFSATNNSEDIAGYENTWSNTTDGFKVNIVNANNNNNDWTYIKMGRKNNASVGSIATDAAIDQPITKVVLTIDALTASKINSIKLYLSANGTAWTEEASFEKATGAQTAAIAAENQAANLYYKIEADCASGSSNGLITISKVEFYRDVVGAPENPTFSVAAGVYGSAQSVALACVTEGAEIRYTLDGSDPTSSSALYSTPIAVATTTTIKAIAIKNSISSDIVSARYKIVSLEGSGTKDDPYSVADVIALEGSRPAAAWVKGYILGGAAAGGVLQVADTLTQNNTAMAIADAKGEADIEKVVSVQLGKDIRQDIADNAGIGALVKVYGTLELYLTVQGVKGLATAEHYVIISTPTAIDETEAANQATKELREGQVLIIKGNKTYNILGQEIK